MVLFAYLGYLKLSFLIGIQGFANAFWTQIFQLLGIDFRFSTAFHYIDEQSEVATRDATEGNLAKSPNGTRSRRARHHTKINYKEDVIIFIPRDTLVGPLGRCVGASDHAMVVCFVAAS